MAERMTDKELKKLNRAELLELLIEQMKENKRLQSELAAANERLEAHDIAIDEAGSIAEASLKLNGVFQAAQAAAAQYLENIRALSVRQEAVCRRKEAECAAACEAMRAKTELECRKRKQSADDYCNAMRDFLQNFYDEHHDLHELITKVEEQNEEDNQPG